jgi:NADH-quinone oxidoreductase subunit L
MDNATLLPLLLGAAWLIPLASFTLIVLAGPRLGKHGVLAGSVATGAILCSFALSMISLFSWLYANGIDPPAHHHGHEAHAAAEGDHAAEEHHADDEHASADHADAAHADEAAHGSNVVPAVSGVWYTLGQFGSLSIQIGYYIDALTIAMFCMVTLIASCIHFYAIGYMHDELHDITDHEVVLSNGHHLHRHGRFYRFFQYLSLFCFSMLGLVIAGNIAMVFVFWELVGVCSYFLIGFYIERKSASTAANKAFIVNRVGDFGMIIGLMALFGALGTFSFGDYATDAGLQPGIFSQVRPAQHDHAWHVPDGMLRSAAAAEIGVAGGSVPTAEQLAAWRADSDPASPDFEPTPVYRRAYWLMIIAGLGIFCGCVGKSAQFPLHVWLPDAMEGPTPVSALVHSATMVAAGVYLVGRFFPVFAPEVLISIAYIGAITLFLAATIAITATDIKRVLAYSTISQLGYMMLALGAGAWMAGLFHLFTHAFFKSLLFMCSGSVIHATHTNEMPKMGGLRHKMPWTAYTMLVGCLAIAGAGIPFVIGFSGYYSKDAIIEQVLLFSRNNPHHSILFYAAAGGAAITAFYMFRLWFMTFAGKPRDHHIYDHAHESPPVMYIPLVVLSIFAVGVAWQLPITDLNLTNLLEQARPSGLMADGMLVGGLNFVEEHESHADDVRIPATLIASTTALSGFLIALAFYGLSLANPAEVAKKFAPIYRFLLNKWYFDELYQVIFIRPVMFVSQLVALFDKLVIDRLIDFLAYAVQRLAMLDDAIDRLFVDGLISVFARWTYSAGLGLRTVQTGQLRTYVLLIVVGTVGLFALVTARWNLF